MRVRIRRSTASSKNESFESKHTTIQTYLLFVQSTHDTVPSITRTEHRHHSVFWQEMRVSLQPHTAWNINESFESKHTAVQTYNLFVQNVACIERRWTRTEHHVDICFDRKWGWASDLILHRKWTTALTASTQQPYKRTGYSCRPHTACFHPLNKDKRTPSITIVVRCDKKWGWNSNLILHRTRITASKASTQQYKRTSC